MPRQRLLQAVAFLLLGLSGQQLTAQGVIGPSGVCKPASMRTQQVGCWIVADDPIGRLIRSSVFWTLDVYSTRAEAEADKGPRGTVLESLGKVWLLNIEYQKSKPSHGSRAAEIGPLSVTAGENYSVQYMEAIFNPGMTAPEHIHSGPEAWYALSGETCLETSDGRVQVGRAGGPPVIVPMGLSMHLTATGTEQRRAVVLILHLTSQPPTTVDHNWVAKGLCNKQ
jgi:quercetin dioxygenase-like cupin family protein